MPYTVYILYSNFLDKFYIGHTGDNLEQRIRRHLSDHSGFTSRAKDWKLVYSEIFPQKSDASMRERELKGWKSSSRIRALIAQSKRG